VSKIFKNKIYDLFLLDAPNIGVIIVDYRSDQHLCHTLESLSKSFGDISLQVIVIENSPVRGSPQPPPDLDVQFIRNISNLGFGRAVNMAREQLQTPFIFLLNPDVMLQAETLLILYEYMIGHPEVGALVPKLLDPDGKLQYSVRKFYDLPTIMLRRSFLGKFFKDHPRLKNHLMANWDHHNTCEVDWALGACMLLRTEAVGDEVFDPRFFLYFEDVDLCLRLKKSGWKVVYHPSAVATHEHRQESRRDSFSRANYEHFISWMKFMAKHKSISGL